MEVLNRVRAEISRYGMLQPGERVVVGVSGGPDSIALLHILRSLQEELKINLHVAHLNHMFRGEEAREEAEFVKNLCFCWGIPCTIAQRDVTAYGQKKGLPASVAAREVRYEFFTEVLEETQGQKIAIAHHADDQAETVLLNILRGAGLKGLGGIAPVREDLYIRPLLNVRRRQIEQYCLEQGLDYRIDSSNLKDVYRRNKLRHHLIPALEKEYSPGLVMILCRMAEQIRSEDEYLEALAAQAYADVLLVADEKSVEIHRGKLAQQPVALVRRILRLAWEKVRGTKQDLTYEHVENLVNRLAEGGSERIFEWPGFIKVRLNYNSLLLTSEGSEQEYTLKPIPLPIPGSITLENGSLITSRQISISELTQNPREYPPTIVALDAERFTQPLLVRSRVGGDTFVPYGLGKRVKLKKFLIDRKVPRHQRDRIPLIVEKASGEILWVAGFRLADRVGITETTKKVILLCFENGNDSNT